MQGTVSGLGRFRRWRAQLERAFVHHRLVVFRKSYDATPRPPDALRLVEHVDLPASAEKLYRDFGRGLPLAKLDARRRHGLRLFELRDGEKSLASTWVVPRGERFLDELGLGFPVGERELWLRDVFVAPHARGRGVFAALLDAVVAQGFPQTRTVWSQVSKSNLPSMRAHQRYGYEVVAEFEVWHLFRRLLWRRRWPKGPWPGSSFHLDRRWLYTGGAYWRFVNERKA